METLITALVSIIAGAIINEILRYFIPIWKTDIKNSLPKKKSSKQRAAIVIKYPFLIIAICLIFFFVPEGKWFVIAVSGVCVIISFFISRDMLIYFSFSLIWDFERDKLNKDIQLWTDRLAMCDKHDKESIEMIKSKIDTMRKKLNSI